MNDEPLQVAQLIDDYVAEHENDSGGQSFMERNAIAMCILHHIACIIREGVKKANDQ